MELKKFFNFIIIPFVLLSCSNKERIFIINGEAQGTTYHIKYINNKELIDKKQIDSILIVFDNSLSTYKENSIISKINNNDSLVKVDAYFEDVFYISKKIYNETNGLFDPTIGALVNAYGFGANKNKNEISAKKIDSLLKYVGFNKVNINSDKSFSKKFDEIYLDFNAIAQGYSVDVICNYLKSKNIKNAMVEIGGEVFALGKNTVENKPWRIGIDHPLQKPDKRTLIAKINLENLGMATSGNYRKVLTNEITGEKYVHIINPINGLTQKNNILSVTILSKSAALADGYATALMLMNIEESKLFLEKNKALDALIIYSNSNNIEEYFTKGFKEKNFK